MNLNIIAPSSKPVEIDDKAPTVLPPTPTAAGIQAIPAALVQSGRPRELFVLVIQYRTALGEDLLQYRDLAAAIQREEAKASEGGCTAAQAMMHKRRADLRRVGTSAAWNAQVVGQFAADLALFVGAIQNERLTLTPPPMPVDGVSWDKQEMTRLRERHAKLAASGRCTVAHLRALEGSVREARGAMSTARFAPCLAQASALLRDAEKVAKL